MNLSKGKISVYLKTAKRLIRKNPARVFFSFSVHMASMAILFLSFVGIQSYQNVKSRLESVRGTAISEINSSSGENLKTKEMFNRVSDKFPRFEFTESHVLKIPAYAKLKYMGFGKFDTDMFFTVYDFKDLKKSGFKEFSQNQKGATNIILPSQAVGVMKEFIFEGLTAETLRFVGGEVVYGKSSFMDWKYPEVSQKINVIGTSDKLPIYAIAVDSGEIDDVLKKMGYKMPDYKLATLTTSKNLTPPDTQKISDFFKSEGITIEFVKLNEDAEKFTEKYGWIVNYVLIPLTIVLFAMTAMTYSLLFKLKTAENSDTVKALRYLRAQYKTIVAVILVDVITMFIVSSLILVSITSYLSSNVFITSVIGTDIISNASVLAIFTVFIALVLNFFTSVHFLEFKYNT